MAELVFGDFDACEDLVRSPPPIFLRNAPDHQDQRPPPQVQSQSPKPGYRSALASWHALPSFKLYFVDLFDQQDRSKHEWAHSPVPSSAVLHQAAVVLPADGLGFVVASPTAIKVYQFGPEHLGGTPLHWKAYDPATFALQPPPFSDSEAGGGSVGDPVELLIVADELMFWLEAGSAGDYLASFSDVSHRHPTAAATATASSSRVFLCRRCAGPTHNTLVASQPKAECRNPLKLQAWQLNSAAAEAAAEAAATVIGAAVSPPGWSAGAAQPKVISLEEIERQIMMKQKVSADNAPNAAPNGAATVRAAAAEKPAGGNKVTKAQDSGQIKPAVLAAGEPKRTPKPHGNRSQAAQSRPWSNLAANQRPAQLTAQASTTASTASTARKQPSASRPAVARPAAAARPASQSKQRQQPASSAEQDSGWQEQRRGKKKASLSSGEEQLNIKSRNQKGTMLWYDNAKGFGFIKKVINATNPADQPILREWGLRRTPPARMSLCIATRCLDQVRYGCCAEQVPPQRPSCIGHSNESPRSNCSL